jgi:hypothetical protein
VVNARRDHNLTVWARDLKQTAWAWSCSCGVRYRKNLPSHAAARAEAHAHARNPGGATDAH